MDHGIVGQDHPQRTEERLREVETSQTEGVLDLLRGQWVAFELRLRAAVLAGEQPTRHVAGRCDAVRRAEGHRHVGAVPGGREPRQHILHPDGYATAARERARRHEVDEVLGAVHGRASWSGGRERPDDQLGDPQVQAGNELVIADQVRVRVAAPAEDAGASLTLVGNRAGIAVVTLRVGAAGGDGCWPHKGQRADEEDERHVESRLPHVQVSYDG